MPAEAPTRKMADGTTPFFLLLLVIATLGPFQFGYHLV
jgi:hypothetical protein